MAVELAHALVHEVVIDDRQAQRGADSAARALDRVADASDNAAGAAQRTRTGLLQLDDATAKFTRGQESAWRALDRWKSRTDDAYRANKTLESATRDLDRAIAQGISTEAEKIQVLDRLRQQTTRYAAANENAARSTKLAAHEVTNLSYQIQDAAVQLAGGQNPFLILMQQGPQATGAVGGVGRAISLLASPTGLAIAAIGGLVAAFALVERHAAALREVETSVTLMGGAIGRSADGMEALAIRAAEAGKISVASAREQEVAYVRAGKLGAESMERLIGLSRDYAVATKQDVDAATEDLAQLFADPVAGAEKLTAAYGLLTGKELERIRVLTATGQAEQARLVLADSLATRTRGLGDQVGTLAAAWERVERAASNAINAIGDATAPETNAQAIARLEERRRQLIAARGLDASRLDGETGGVAVPEGAVPVDSRYSAPGMGASRGELATTDAELAQRYAQRGRDREMAARVGDWQGQVKNSAAADEVARSARPMATEITSLTDSITKLESGLKNPGLMAFADDAGRALEGLKNKRADYEAAAAKGIDIETDKRQRLAAVEQKYAGLVGPAAEARKAAEVESINLLGTATTKEERRLAVGTAVTQVTAGQARAVAELSLSLSAGANAARLNAEAAGLGEAAMRRAAIEAEVYAHRMDGTAAAVRAAREEQEKSARAQIHNEFVRGIDQQIAANSRLIAAYGVSGQAVSEANRYNEAYLQTLREYPESIRNTAEGEDLWTKALDRNINKLKERDLSRLNKDISAYADALRRAKEDLAIDRATAGLSDLAALDLRARYDALKAMGLTIEKYGELDAATRRNVDIQLEGAAAIARQQQEVYNYRDAWDTVNSSLDKSFERLGDSLVDAIVQGKDASIDFGNLWKGITASILSDLTRLASVDLRRMVGLGGNTQGSLLDLFGSPANQNAANQNGAGLTGQATDMATNWGAGKALSWAGDKLGLTGGFEAAMSTPLWTGTSGVAPGFVDVVGAEAITNTAAATGGGATLGGVLGAAGAGALGGAVGGMIGTSANSKAVGGLSGAALGAVAAYGANLLGLSALGGPIGLGIGAVVGGIMGLVGTQKASVGPNAQGNVVVSGGRFSEGPSAADNGGDATGVRQATAQIAAAFNAMADAYGLKAPDGTYGLFTGGPKVKGNGVRTPEELIKQLVGSLSADGLVGRALGSDVVKGASDLEQINSYLGLAKRIETATTALSEMDKSIGAVQKAAFKAAADGLAPMLEEMKKAGEIGASAEYKALVSGQVTNLLDDIANPRTYTETQTAVATLTGQLAAWKSVLEQVNPELAKTIDTIQEKGLERIYAGVRTTYAANMNEAQGLSYRNSLQGVRDYWNANALDMVAAGRDPNALYEAQAKAIIDGLSDSQIDDVVAYFKDLDPVMSKLADSLRGTTTAAKERSKEMASALEDLTLREMAAKVQLGQVSQDAYDAEALRIKQTRELAEVTDAGVRSRLAEVQALERQGAAMVKLTAQAGSLTAWLNDQKLGNLSALSAPEQLSEAQRQFGAALSGSDASAVTAAASALLSVGRTMYGTTADYAALSSWTTGSVTEYGRRRGLPGYAVGTDSALAGWAMVGEEGPELVRFRGGERVFTAPQTRAMLGGDVTAKLEEVRRELVASRQTNTRMQHVMVGALALIQQAIEASTDAQAKAALQAKLAALLADQKSEAA
ncbi:phage tail length tape measure family protein [Azospirillum brasilense]|nr:phage tail length tape measure family protein [Azospirillum brasilense]